MQLRQVRAMTMQLVCCVFPSTTRARGSSSLIAVRFSSLPLENWFAEKGKKEEMGPPGFEPESLRMSSLMERSVNFE